MNAELYNKWIKSHQIEGSHIDITEAAMSCITKKTRRPNVIKQACESVLLDMMQAKVFVRSCVLASGAIMGILRMILQIYSVLFT